MELKGISYSAFTIPADTTPGSYTVSATTEDGDTSTADLTVTAPSEAASAAPAMGQEPTGELHEVDRSKPLGEIIAVMAVIALRWWAASSWFAVAPSQSKEC